MLKIPQPLDTTDETPPVPVSAPVPAARPSKRRNWSGRAILDDPITATIVNGVWSGDPLTIVPSPPGAGKTRLVVHLAPALCTAADMRVGIAAQTRAQVIEIAERLLALTDRVMVGWSAADPPPKSIPADNIGSGGTLNFPGSAGGIIVGTTRRWLGSKYNAVGCDVILVDEAWQATYADVAALGAFTDQIVCVGDPGQIEPVVRGSTARWQGQPTGPHVPAPDALLAAHDDVATVVALPHTWRLGQATTDLIQPAFYPHLPFTSRRPAEHISVHGEPLPELFAAEVTRPASPVDPALMAAAADSVTSLLGAAYVTTAGTRPLAASDFAVVAAHVNQSAAIRSRLASHPEVLVGTANQLQGLERPVTVAVHPLAGHPEITDFNADLGRACVMLSRHRAHLTVVTDSETRTRLLRTTEPAAASHLHVLTALGM